MADGPKLPARAPDAKIPQNSSFTASTQMRISSIQALKTVHGEHAAPHTEGQSASLALTAAMRISICQDCEDHALPPLCASTSVPSVPVCLNSSCEGPQVPF